MPKKNNYIDKQEFHILLAEQKRKIAEAEKEGKPKPQLDPKIAEAFHLIATKMASNHKFFGYTYKEDMVSEATMNCIQYWENYNEKIDKPNPFGYFSLIIFNAFKRYIEKENKYGFVKSLAMERAAISLELNDEASSADFINTFLSDNAAKINHWKEKLNVKSG